MTKVSRELILLRAILSPDGPKEVIYQASGSVSGLEVQMDVYKPDKVKDEGQSGLATEIGVTGRYYMSFTADSPGWFVLIHDDTGGNAVRQF